MSLDNPPIFSNNLKYSLREYYNNIIGTEFTTVTQIKKHLAKNLGITLETTKDVYTFLNNEFKENKVAELTEEIKSNFNHRIANPAFVDTTMSSQISLGFALGEYSFQTKDINFVSVISYEMVSSDIGQQLLQGFTGVTEADKLAYLIDNVDNIFNILESSVDKLIHNLFSKLMEHAGNFYNRIFITNRETGKVVSSKLVNNMAFHDFNNVIQHILQSNDVGVLGTLVFTIQYRNMPNGGKGIAIPKFLQSNNGITRIINDDGLCGQRCLVFADCYRAGEKVFREIKSLKYTDRYEKKVKMLCIELELKDRMNFTDFEKYADLRHVQIVIVAGLFVEMYSTKTEYEEQIYIYYDTSIQHYHFIHNINMASNDSKQNNKWCRYCKKSIRRKNFDKHKCIETKCSCCYTVFENIACKEKHFADAKANKAWAKCLTCNLWCAGAECLEKHSVKCKGCAVKCDICKCWDKNRDIDGFGFKNKSRIGQSETTHICGEKFCRNCDKYYTGEHRCFITKLELKEFKQTIMVYDFESLFDDENNHIVNLCIVKQLYSENKWYFDTIEEFTKFAVEQKNTTFIAHNGKAYDTWMVHKYLIKHTGLRPNKLILAGNKIMYMKVKTVRFIDSLNHIAQGLASFPKTFGVTEMKKGFFPYLFNVKENQNYVGVVPDKHYFNPSSMSCDKFKEFEKWYSAFYEKSVIYDFKKELFEYCESDVDILKRSMEIYIDDAMKVTGINPLSCSTIASYAMKVFRTHYLNENQISVMTKEEYDFCKRGFFGGRTEVFKLFQTWTEEDIKNGRYGKYVDIQSLYPSVQFFDDLPCGVPIWDTKTYSNMTDEWTADYIETHYGYIECDVVCPSNLHIPLLAEKKNGKLIFDLVPKIQKVYTSVELKRAIEIGYKITKIYRALSFEKNKDMFKGYIQTFLKIKTECSGYDGDNVDDYIARYNTHCGVLLEKDKIIANSGMKLLAKILLNSLWGKFGQNDELPTTAYIKNDAWFRLLDRHSRGKIELKNEILIDEDILYVSYIEKEEEQTSLMTTNLGLAGFVTGNARLRLYKELYKLGSRAVYCDTDSIIYEYIEGEYNVEESDLLGEWELEKGGNLKEVYALAPKTYGYKSIDGTEKYKCKGITLNHGNTNHFTYDKLKTLITGEKKEKIITYSDDFIKDNKNGKIYTKKNVPKDTNYNIADFKRIFNTENGSSKPFC